MNSFEDLKEAYWHLGKVLTDRGDEGLDGTNAEPRYLAHLRAAETLIRQGMSDVDVAEEAALYVGSAPRGLTSLNQTLTHLDRSADAGDASPKLPLEEARDIAVNARDELNTILSAFGMEPTDDEPLPFHPRDARGPMGPVIGTAALILLAAIILSRWCAP